MTIELRMLVGSVLLGFVHIIAASHAVSLQCGYRWSASARDGELAPLTGIAGRLDRALRNFSETFPLFAALVFATYAVGCHDALTESGAALYFVARLIYLPLQAFGVPLVRSLVWNVAVLGMALMRVALLWPQRESIRTTRQGGVRWTGRAFGDQIALQRAAIQLGQRLAGVQ